MEETQNVDDWQQLQTTYLKFRCCLLLTTLLAGHVLFCR